jgi:hypothetical protein
MANQNIKTNYATTHPDATDVSGPEAKHEARRQLNRDLREKQTPKIKAVKQYDEPIGPRRQPTLVSSTKELFSGHNVVETGKAAVKSGRAAVGSGLVNMGNRVGHIASVTPSWIRGSPIPEQYLSMPYVHVGIKPERKHKKSRKGSTKVVVSNRPEWIRF